MSGDLMQTQSLQESFHELCSVLPGGVSSPARAYPGSQLTPLVLERASADQITDVTNKTYIDFCASWGALILGHAEPDQMQHLYQQMLKGTSYGVTTRLEYEFALEIQKHMPSMQKMRFVNSGTESTMYALRLARGYTGRDYIVKFSGNYHGCADFLLTQAGSGFATHQAMTKGIPNESVQYTLNLPYNDLEALETLFEDRTYKDKIAAVIIEPIVANMGCTPCDPSYMKRLRELTQQKGTLLIFDEVVTGFRLGLGGAQEYFDIEADLTCLGKIVGGGFPLAVYGGKKEIMDYLSPLGPIYQAGTLSGNPVAVASGLYVLKEISKPGFFAQLNQKTQDFLDPIENALAKKEGLGCIQKVGSMFTLFWGVQRVRNFEDSCQSNKELFWSFFKYLLDRGIYWTPSNFECCFMMRSHTKEHLDYVQKTILEFIDQQ